MNSVPVNSDLEVPDHSQTIVTLCNSAKASASSTLLLLLLIPLAFHHYHHHHHHHHHLDHYHHHHHHHHRDNQESSIIDHHPLPLFQRGATLQKWLLYPFLLIIFPARCDFRRMIALSLPPPKNGGLSPKVARLPPPNTQHRHRHRHRHRHP